jgi:hypothetical protein
MSQPSWSHVSTIGIVFQVIHRKWRSLVAIKQQQKPLKSGFLGVGGFSTRRLFFNLFL